MVEPPVVCVCVGVCVCVCVCVCEMWFIDYSCMRVLLCNEGEMISDVKTIMVRIMAYIIEGLRTRLSCFKLDPSCF